VHICPPGKVIAVEATSTTRSADPPAIAPVAPVITSGPRHGAHGQQGPTVTRPVFRFIQLLRGLAALMVVAHHATIMLADRNHLPIANWINGSSGVDIFFIISGFVMTVSSAPLLGARHPGRTFLARRLERVVPMYWLVTTVKVALLALIPALGLNALGSPGQILCSYLFIPALNPEHLFEPVVVVGWTLNFEMAFYLLFALALALRRPPLWILAAPLLWFGLWTMFRPAIGPVWLQFFQNSLVLEFLFGVLLALALRWIRHIPWPVGLLLLAAGIVPLFTWLPRNPLTFMLERGLVWGLPALTVVLGAVVLEPRWGARSPRWALELGNASYSIYLVHTLVLPGIGLLLARVQHPHRHEIGFGLSVAILLSTVAGVLVYRLVELPLTNWFKAGRRTAVPARA
jgi:exopolysaccharide production protein ExoZ